MPSRRSRLDPASAVVIRSSSVARFDFHSSPLLSTLGIVALAGAASPIACHDEGGGPAPIDDVSDLSDIYQDYYAFYCECYAELYGESAGGEECLGEAEIFSDGQEACLREVFDANPAAFDVFRCEAEALRDLVACKQAEGCPTPFACSDGTMVPTDFVCDGFPDCSDGADEAQDCPPPEMCSDGQTLPTYSICDGFEDCSDGSDELDCPAPFQCSDGTEIPPAWICDGGPDCEDGSDEQQMCPVTCDSRFASQEDACGDVSDEVDELISDCFGYSCADGAEITNGQVCDGQTDCAGGEDEEFCDIGTSGG